MLDIYCLLIFFALVQCAVWVNNQFCYRKQWICPLLYHQEHRCVRGFFYYLVSFFFFHKSNTKIKYQQLNIWCYQYKRCRQFVKKQYKPVWAKQVTLHTYKYELSNKCKNAKGTHMHTELYYVLILKQSSYLVCVQKIDMKFVVVSLAICKSNGFRLINIIMYWNKCCKYNNTWTIETRSNY